MSIHEKGFGSCINCGESVAETAYWLNSYGPYFNSDLSKVFCGSKCSLDFHEKYGITGEINELGQDLLNRMNQQLARSDYGG